MFSAQIKALRLAYQTEPDKNKKDRDFYHGAQALNSHFIAKRAGEVAETVALLRTPDLHLHFNAIGNGNCVFNSFWLYLLERYEQTPYAKRGNFLELFDHLVVDPEDRRGNLIDELIKSYVRIYHIFIPPQFTKREDRFEYILQHAKKENPERFRGTLECLFGEALRILISTHPLIKGVDQWGENESRSLQEIGSIGCKPRQDWFDIGGFCRELFYYCGLHSVNLHDVESFYHPSDLDIPLMRATRNSECQKIVDAALKEDPEIFYCKFVNGNHCEPLFKIVADSEFDRIRQKHRYNMNQKKSSSEPENDNSYKSYIDLGNEEVDKIKLLHYDIDGFCQPIALEKPSIYSNEVQQYLIFDKQQNPIRVYYNCRGYFFEESYKDAGGNTCFKSFIFRQDGDQHINSLVELNQKDNYTLFESFEALTQIDNSFDPLTTSSQNDSHGPSSRIQHSSEPQNDNFDASYDALCGEEDDKIKLLDYDSNGFCQPIALEKPSIYSNEVQQHVIFDKQQNPICVYYNCRGYFFKESYKDAGGNSCFKSFIYQADRKTLINRLVELNQKDNYTLFESWEDFSSSSSASTTQDKAETKGNRFFNMPRSLENPNLNSDSFVIRPLKSRSHK